MEQIKKKEVLNMKTPLEFYLNSLGYEVLAISDNNCYIKKEDINMTKRVEDLTFKEILEVGKTNVFDGKKISVEPDLQAEIIEQIDQAIETGFFNNIHMRVLRLVKHTLEVEFHFTKICINKNKVRDKIFEVYLNELVECKIELDKIDVSLL